MKNYKNVIAVVAAGISCAAISSNAALTNHGAVGTVTGVPSQSYSAPFATTPPTAFSGIWSSSIIPNDAVATGLGYTGETFVFQANVNAGDVLQAMTINGFGGVTPLGFGYVSTANPNANPALVSQANTPSGQININFGNGYVGVGDLLYLFTNFKTPGTLVLDGVQDTLNAVVLGFAPVPEPTTVLAGALMLLPLGVSTVRILRNRKTA